MRSRRIDPAGCGRSRRRCCRWSTLSAPTSNASSAARRRRGQRAGHLSAGAAAGRDSVSSPDGARRRSLPAVWPLRLRQPRPAGQVPASVAGGDRSARHPAHGGRGRGGEPAQVVWRQAPLIVEEVSSSRRQAISPSSCLRVQSAAHIGSTSRAPLMRVMIAQMRPTALGDDAVESPPVERPHDAGGDRAGNPGALLGQAERLPEPLPFRNFVAQARLGVSREEHEAFFREMLGDVDEPTSPFGLANVHGDGSGIEEARREVDAIGAAVAGRARARRERCQPVPPGVGAVWRGCRARGRGVRHGAVRADARRRRAPTGRWGCSSTPCRCGFDLGEEGAQESVRQTHAVLTQLLRHEHAPLALAQRCSGCAAPAPLFSALLNYRHNAGACRGCRRGAAGLGGDRVPRWRRADQLSVHAECGRSGRGVCAERAGAIAD